MLTKNIAQIIWQFWTYMDKKKSKLKTRALTVVFIIYCVVLSKKMEKKMEFWEEGNKEMFCLTAHSTHF